MRLDELENASGNASGFDKCVGDSLDKLRQSMAVLESKLEDDVVRKLSHIEGKCTSLDSRICNIEEQKECSASPCFNFDDLEAQ
eukprot:8482458-Karenia_brevis.AAC.1